MKKYLTTFVILLTFLLLTENCMQKNNQNDVFKNYLESVNSTDNKEEKTKLTDDFINKISPDNYPIYEDDTTYVLLYRGDKDSAGVIGDMTNWTDKLWMDKVEGTDLFYYRGTAEPTARIEYWLMYGENSFPSIDSLNQYIVLNGFGQISELAMPKYERHEYFNNYIHGEKGSGDSLKHHVVPSKYLNYDHDIDVYLPPNYSEDKKYPVLYLNDGYDFVEFAATPYVLDRLINENKIEPIIAVFVTPPNRFEPKFPNRMTEYGMNDDYVKFLADELVPFIDEHYSTKQDSESRMIEGASYGGLISLYVGFSRPDVFGKVYSQSGYHSFQKDRMINLIKESEKKNIKIYIDVGTYEEIIGANLLPDGERDFTQGNRDMNEALKEKGYDFVYKEYYEGHTWGNWRRHLIDAVIYFFGK